MGLSINEWILAAEAASTQPVYMDACNSIRARDKNPPSDIFQIYLCKMWQKWQLRHKCNVVTGATQSAENFYRPNEMNGRMLLKVGPRMQREIYLLYRAVFTLGTQAVQLKFVGMCAVNLTPLYKCYLAQLTRAAGKHTNRYEFYVERTVLVVEQPTLMI